MRRLVPGDLVEVTKFDQFERGVGHIGYRKQNLKDVEIMFYGSQVLVLEVGIKTAIHTLVKVLYKDQILYVINRKYDYPTPWCVLVK